MVNFMLGIFFHKKKKSKKKGFPSGTVMKNAPAHAGDEGLTPRPGRPHMQQSD